MLRTFCTTECYRSWSKPSIQQIFCSQFNTKLCNPKKLSQTNPCSFSRIQECKIQQMWIYRKHKTPRTSRKLKPLTLFCNKFSIQSQSTHILAVLFQVCACDLCFYYKLFPCRNYDTADEHICINANRVTLRCHL